MNVSICLTLKNEEGSIADLLNSLLNQSKKPDEIIIVDGGSEDTTLDLIRHYQKKDKRIKLLIENKEMSYPALFILLVTATLSLFGALLALIVLFIYFNARKSREAMAALLASFFMVLLCDGASRPTHTTERD